MKKLILTASILALVATNVPTARAGDCGWATAGKVLTGVAAGVVLANALDCDTRTSVTVAYRAPIACAPAPVVCAPRRVVVAPAPVVYAPRVVYATPVYVAPSPVLVYSKYGHGHRWGRGHHKRY